MTPTVISRYLQRGEIERFPEGNYSTGKAYFYNIISTFFGRSFAIFQQELVVPRVNVSLSP